MGIQRLRPTEAELTILRVLWEGGPATVREIHKVLSAERPTGYTTVLKLLQIMTEKGLVERDESRRPQVYRPAYSQQQTQRQLLAQECTLCKQLIFLLKSCMPAAKRALTRHDNTASQATDNTVIGPRDGSEVPRNGSTARRLLPSRGRSAACCSRFRPGNPPQRNVRSQAGASRPVAGPSSRPRHPRARRICRPGPRR